jgi:hypothetical protein
MNTHNVRHIGLLLILLPTTLMAQVQRHVIPLTSWPAPFYWQPNSAETKAAVVNEMTAGKSTALHNQ